MYSPVLFSTDLKGNKALHADIFIWSMNLVNLSKLQGLELVIKYSLKADLETDIFYYDSLSIKCWSYAYVYTSINNAIEKW